MQNRRGAKNSDATNENLHKSNGRNYERIESSDSSDEYEEETHISYQFRRWANHIWSVSNNVTSRLRGLLANHPSSNTTSNHSVEESCQDESNATCSSTTSSDIIESSTRVNNRDCNTRHYHQRKENHDRSSPRENFCRHGQEFSHMTEDRGMRNVTANRLDTRPNFIMGHGVATYPPVLILPRLHQGVNRQPMDSDSYQSRKHISRRQNMHGDQCADGWYQHDHQLGKWWDYEGSRRGDNHLSLSDRHRTPEKLSFLTNDQRVEDFERKPTRTSRVRRKIETGDYGFKSVKHLGTHVSDFRSQSYENGHESTSPIHNTRRSREQTFARSRIPRNYGDNVMRQNSNHSLKSTAHTKPKKLVWDMELSDITTQEPRSTNPSRVIALSAKSSVMLNIEEKKSFADRNLKSPPALHENVKDDAKQQRTAISPAHDIKTVEHSQNSHDIQTEKKIREKQNGDLANGKGIKWSSVTENSVDLLLQSLRERMDTLANVHSLDTGTNNKSGSIEFNGKDEASLTKECIVASYLAETYLPQCLEGQNQMAVNSVVKNEELRPSFSDRIQDIWRDGRARVWRSSPRHQTTSSRYNLKSEKDLPSKLSLLRMDDQPVLREYFGEYNNAVTLARILEKLIDSKSRSDAIPSLVSQAPKPPSRVSCEQLKTCLQVNVGVQKSTPISTTSSQDRASCSRHRLIEKHGSRRSFKRDFKPRLSELPTDTPRPLQVFSGQSLIPISSIQFIPVTQPFSNYSEFSAPPLQGKRSSARCYEDPSAEHGHSIIVDSPVVRDANCVSVADAGLKCSPFFSSRGSPSLFVKDERLILRGVQSVNNEEINRQVINEEGRILSSALKEIERKHQRAQSIARNSEVRQQYALHYSRPVRLQERVAKDRADAPSQGVSTKGRSWWKKKFHFNRSRNLKEKMASILKYVTKKDTDDKKDDHPLNYAFEKTRHESVVPIPPIRARRKCNAGVTKSSKSMQWKLDENELRSIEKIDSFQETENQQSNKSTSVDPIIRRVTTSSGTNTYLTKSHKTNTKLSLIQNRGAGVIPEIIQVWKLACTVVSNEFLAPDQALIKSDIVADVKEKSESWSTDDKPSFNDLPLPVKENFESLVDSCRKGERDSGRSDKFKVPRSLSSKIPLATKPASPCNDSSTISAERPSTAPIFENLSSHSSRSNAFLGEFEVGKSLGREYVNQEAAQKMLFKHNRSSLLRANNSMPKKCAMGQFSPLRKTVEEKNVDKKSIFNASSSAVQIDGEKSPLNSSLVKETRGNKFVSEKQLHGNTSDLKTKSLPTEDEIKVSDYLETRVTSSTPEEKAKQTVAGKIHFCDISGISLVKAKDLTHSTENINLLISLPRPQLIDSKHPSNYDAKNLLGDEENTYNNLKHSKDKRRSSKASTSPLDVTPYSLHAKKEQEKTIMKWELQKPNDNDNIIGCSRHLKDKNRSYKAYLTLCERVSNVKSGKFEKLLIQPEVSEDPNSTSVDFKESKVIDSNNIGLSNLNVCKLQSDMKSDSTENSAVKEQPEGFSACRVEIDEVKTTLNEKTKFRPGLASSIIGKTEKYLFEHPDVPVQKPTLRNKEIRTLDRSRRPCLQSKSIRSSRLSPQRGIGKSSVKSVRLLCKHITPSSSTVNRLNRANNGPSENLSEVYGVVDDSQNSIVQPPKSQDLDSVAVYKTANTVSRVTRNTKNIRQKLTKMSKTRNKDTEEILQLLRKVIDTAINASVNIDRRMSLAMVYSKRNTLQHIPSNSEKSPLLSIDSLESIRVYTPWRTSPLIAKKIPRATTDEVDERYSVSCPLNEEKECGSLCAQKQQSIWLKRAQSHLSPAIEVKVISDAINDGRRNDCNGMKSSKKFLAVSKPLPRDQTSEIPTQLNIKSPKDTKNESKFAAQKSRIPRVRFDKPYNKFKTTAVPTKVLTDKNRKEMVPFEMEYDLTQSIITFDSVEIVDKPEKPRPYMLNVHLKSRVEFSKSKLQGSISKKKFGSRELLNTDSNSIVVDDEKSGKSSNGGRNVEIDNKVLEEKVKCSIENGVPLKTITITDPSIIKHNCLNKNSRTVDKITRRKDLEKTRSEVQSKLPKKLYNNSQDLLLDSKSEGQYSHTTWVSHKNRDINVENKTISKTRAKPENVELLHTAEDIAQIIDKSTFAVEQNNLVLSMTRSESNKKSTRRRTTLIPRYKKKCS